MKRVHDAEPRKHYYLIHGAVVFSHVERNDVASVDLNGLLTTDDKKFALHELNNSQRILQHNFFNRIPHDKVEVQDVVIKNFCYMGHYTEAEFRNIPEGVVMQMREETQKNDTPPASEAIIDQIPANDPEPTEIPDENPDRIDGNTGSDAAANDAFPQPISSEPVADTAAGDIRPATEAEPTTETPAES